MGCDIHLYVERRENGTWLTADRWTPDEDAKEGETPRLRVDYNHCFYRGRNYNLFAILADVRNGRGFAGIKTGEGFNPIDDPRGLPDDVCELVKAESDGWGCDGHSHSYFTLAELLAYDWTQVSCLQGCVTLAEFEPWNRWRKDRGLGPESYCDFAGGQSVKRINNEEMVELMKPLKELRGDEYTKAFAALLSQHQHTYTLVEWTEPYYRAAASFVGETIWKLLRIGNPADVRIVFWFDN